MRISFSDTLKNRFLCWASNKYEDYTMYIWNKRRHRATCRICGDVLDSRVDAHSPEQCGWKKIRGELYNPWICHRCLCHRDFKPFIDTIDKQEEEDGFIF